VLFRSAAAAAAPAPTNERRPSRQRPSPPRAWARGPRCPPSPPPEATSRGPRQTLVSSTTDSSRWVRLGLTSDWSNQSAPSAGRGPSMAAVACRALCAGKSPVARGAAAVKLAWTRSRRGRQQAAGPGRCLGPKTGFPQPSVAPPPPRAPGPAAGDSLLGGDPLRALAAGGRRGADGRHHRRQVGAGG
jgi:hypothetical protein